MPEQEFGSDGQLHDVAEQGELNETGVAGRAWPVTVADPFEASEPASAAQRLRAFEDEHLGPDAPRINGHVEKGHGSAFKSLSPAHHRHYGALERLHAAETNLSDAESKLAAAQSDHEAAKAQVETAAEAAVERSESEKGG